VVIAVVLPHGTATLIFLLNDPPPNSAVRTRLPGRPRGATGCNAVVLKPVVYRGSRRVAGKRPLVGHGDVLGRVR
jgi:hypothetical protein